MVTSDSTRHRMRARVMREMLREQSGPEGTKKWNSRPPIVTQPAVSGQRLAAFDGSTGQLPHTGDEMAVRRRRRQEAGTGSNWTADSSEACAPS